MEKNKKSQQLHECVLPQCIPDAEWLKSLNQGNRIQGASTRTDKGDFVQRLNIKALNEHDVADDDEGNKFLPFELLSL